MKVPLLMLFLISLFSINQCYFSRSYTTAIGLKCIGLIDYSFFNLNTLTVPSASPTDDSIDVEGGKIFYNFCSETRVKAKDPPAQAVFQSLDETIRVKVAGEAKSLINWTLLDAKNPNSGLKLDWSAGEECTNDKGEKTNYKIHLELTCKSTMKPGDRVKFTNQADFKFQQCENTLKGESLYACPDNSLLNLYAFILQYYYLFGGALIILGVFLILFGQKLYEITIFVLAFVISGAFFLTLTFQFFVKDTSDPAVKWVVLGICAILGLIIAYFIIKLNKLFFILLGASLGYLLGNFLYIFILNFIPGNVNLVFFSTIGVCMVICAALAYFLSDFLLILSTSFIGSYSLVYGVSLYLEPLINIGLIFELAKNGAWDQVYKLFTPYQWSYFASMIVLIIFGLIYQSAQKNSKTREVKYVEVTRERFIV